MLPAQPDGEGAGVRHQTRVLHIVLALEDAKHDEELT